MRPDWSNLITQLMAINHKYRLERAQCSDDFDLWVLDQRYHAESDPIREQLQGQISGTHDQWVTISSTGSIE